MFLTRASRLFPLRLARYSASPLASICEVQPSERVSSIAEQLCSLNLLETTQLVTILQDRLKLNPLASASFIASSGPVSASTSVSAPEIPKVEKTDFKATLQKIDPSSKAKIIREIKLILPQLNLVEAKAFVEGAPKMIKEKLKKDEAEKIKKTLEELGATITLE